MKKDPTNAWTDLYDFAAKIRAGSLDYSEIEDFDINSRLKWTGMLSRFRRTPGRFMMRLRIPNGIVRVILLDYLLIRSSPTATTSVSWTLRRGKTSSCGV